MREALIRLLEPVIEALGYELIEIELAQAGRGMNLRLFIDVAQNMGGADNPQARQAGVTVDDCARVSRAVSETLDVEEPVQGHYTLEVSSPGWDRPLRKAAHFVRFTGERVSVGLKLP